jgi:hypothetical protein
MRQRYEQEIAESLWVGLHWLLIILSVAAFAVTGSFIISVFLTNLLFQLINQLTDQALDKNEGLALMIGAVVFGAVALLFTPFVVDAGVPIDQAIGWVLVAGMVWGLAVSYKVMLNWWQQIEQTSLPVVDFSQQLKLPKQLYQSAEQR